MPNAPQSETPKVQFTQEEEAILTPFDAAAADFLRKEAAKRKAHSPAWLCCSDEVRANARREVLVLLRLGTGRLNLSAAEAAELTQRTVPASMLDMWREMELTLKQARAEGNPRAYFIG